MQFGKFLGMMFLLFGGLLTFMLDNSLRAGDVILKILVAGPALAVVGIALLFFHGGNITLNEINAKQKEPGVFIEEAPKSHKIVWGVALAAGVILAMNWNIFL